MIYLLIRLTVFDDILLVIYLLPTTAQTFGICVALLLCFADRFELLCLVDKASQTFGIWVILKTLVHFTLHPKRYERRHKHTVRDCNVLLFSEVQSFEKPPNIIHMIYSHVVSS